MKRYRLVKITNNASHTSKFVIERRFRILFWNYWTKDFNTSCDYSYTILEEAENMLKIFNKEIEWNEKEVIQEGKQVLNNKVTFEGFKSVFDFINSQHVNTELNEDELNKEYCFYRESK